MGSMSDYVENNILNSLLRGTAWPAVSGNTYVGLSTADPLDDGSGIAEPAGGSYARVAVSRATGSWDAPANQAGAQKTANTGAVTFAAPTGNWGTITHFFVSDASSGGNMLMSGALTTPRTINNGDGAPSFAAGTLTITES